MSILTSELKFKRSAEVSDATTNGGRVSKNIIVSNTLQNVFPNAFSAERAAGSRKYRKIFSTNQNDADLILYNPHLRIFDITNGGDWVVFGAGTQRDTQGSAPTVSRWYGPGRLNADVSAGAQSFIVDLEDNELKSGTYALFAVDDKIIITDKSTWDGAGNIEELVVDTVTPHGSLAQVTLTTVGQTANAYTAAALTKISSIYNPSDLKASYDSLVVTTAGSGDYDDTSYPIVPDNIGSKEITLTGTVLAGGVTMSFVDDEATDWGTWTFTTADFSPSNPDWTKPLFTIFKDGMTGVWAENDTLVFILHPSAVPIWEMRRIPAACGSLANNKVVVVWGGESA